MRATALALLLAGCAPAVDDGGVGPGDTDPSGGDPVDTGGPGPIDTDDGGGGGGGGNGGGASPLVDPTCTDGLVDAPMPTGASLADLKADFGTLGPLAFAQAALDARWPTGRIMLDGGMQGESGTSGCFFDYTQGQRGSAKAVLQAASTFVHECGHVLDNRLGDGFRSAYRIDADHLISACAGGSYQDLPARSRILDDAWASLRPPCGGRARSGCDMYGDIYLAGDPTDGTFDMGDQGLDTVLEEAVQYVHSLGAGYAFEDQLDAGTSITERDGILTFLWYTERYLHLLRTTTPAKYDAVLAKPCWRDAILQMWGSAWDYLEATKGHRALGIDDADLLELVQDPDLLDEIQRVRDAEGCD